MDVKDEVHRGEGLQNLEEEQDGIKFDDNLQEVKLQSETSGNDIPFTQDTNIRINWVNPRGAELEPSILQPKELASSQRRLESLLGRLFVFLVFAIILFVPLLIRRLRLRANVRSSRNRAGGERDINDPNNSSSNLDNGGLAMKKVEEGIIGVLGVGIGIGVAEAADKVS